MITFACGKCGRQFKLDDSKAGKRGECPDCGETVHIPQATAQPVAPSGGEREKVAPRQQTKTGYPGNAAGSKMKMGIVAGVVLAGLVGIGVWWSSRPATEPQSAGRQEAPDVRAPTGTGGAGGRPAAKGVDLLSPTHDSGVRKVEIDLAAFTTPAAAPDQGDTLADGRFAPGKIRLQSKVLRTIGPDRRLIMLGFSPDGKRLAAWCMVQDRAEPVIFEITGDATISEEKFKQLMALPITTRPAEEEQDYSKMMPDPDPYDQYRKNARPECDAAFSPNSQHGVFVTSQGSNYRSRGGDYASDPAWNSVVRNAQRKGWGSVKLTRHEAFVQHDDRAGRKYALIARSRRIDTKTRDTSSDGSGPGVSNDGRTVSYLAFDPAKGWLVVTNDQEYPVAWAAVRSIKMADRTFTLYFSPNRKRYLHAVPEQDGGKTVQRIYLDNKPIGKCESLLKVYWSNDSKRVAYLTVLGTGGAEGKPQRALVVDGKPFPIDSTTMEFAFSDDSAHYAFLTAERMEFGRRAANVGRDLTSRGGLRREPYRLYHNAVVVHNGVKSPPYARLARAYLPAAPVDKGPWARPALTFSPRGSLRYRAVIVDGNSAKPQKDLLLYTRTCKGHRVALIEDGRELPLTLETKTVPERKVLRSPDGKSEVWLKTVRDASAPPGPNAYRYVLTQNGVDGAPQPAPPSCIAMSGGGKHVAAIYDAPGWDNARLDLDGIEFKIDVDGDVYGMWFVAPDTIYMLTGFISSKGQVHTWFEHKVISPSTAVVDKVDIPPTDLADKAREMLDVVNETIKVGGSSSKSRFVKDLPLLRAYLGDVAGTLTADMSVEKRIKLLSMAACGYARRGMMDQAEQATLAALADLKRLETITLPRAGIQIEAVAIALATIGDTEGIDKLLTLLTHVDPARMEKMYYRLAMAMAGMGHYRQALARIETMKNPSSLRQAALVQLTRLLEDKGHTTEGLKALYVRAIEHEWIYRIHKPEKDPTSGWEAAESFLGLCRIGAYEDAADVLASRPHGRARLILTEELLSHCKSAPDAKLAIALAVRAGSPLHAAELCLTSGDGQQAIVHLEATMKALKPLDTKRYLGDLNEVHAARDLLLNRIAVAFIKAGATEKAVEIIGERGSLLNEARFRAGLIEPKTDLRLLAYMGEVDKAMARIDRRRASVADALSTVAQEHFLGVLARSNCGKVDWKKEYETSVRIASTPGADGKTRYSSVRGGSPPNATRYPARFFVASADKGETSLVDAHQDGFNPIQHLAVGSALLRRGNLEAAARYFRQALRHPAGKSRYPKWLEYNRPSGRTVQCTAIDGLIRCGLVDEAAATAARVVHHRAESGDMSDPFRMRIGGHMDLDASHALVMLQCRRQGLSAATQTARSLDARTRSSVMWALAHSCVSTLDYYEGALPDDNLLDWVHFRTTGPMETLVRARCSRQCAYVLNEIHRSRPYSPQPFEVRHEPPPTTAPTP